MEGEKQMVFQVLLVLLGGGIGWFLSQNRLKKVEQEKMDLHAENVALKMLAAEREKSFMDLHEKCKLEFENLSSRILKENSKEFAMTSQLKIEELVSPLKQKIDLFQTNIHEISKTGTAERLELKYKMETMAGFSKALAEETHRLSRVLKGDVKKQGTWGELVLQRVLESSGLRENIEYTLQGTGLSLNDSEGRRMQPDVLVNLPDAKKIIIDSKMSYTHYDDYFNGSTEEAKAESLRKLVISLKDHVKDLSEKKYQFAKNLENPDFVLLFVPVEAIFSLVIEAEPTLFEEAWKKSIIIVSPANVLAILRTIESIWKIERQNRNTQKIAEEASSLYDKFVDLLKDLETAGKHLKGAGDLFDKAMGKISSGRGNLIKKTEDLKRLGLKTKKQIPAEFLLEEEEEAIL